MRLLGSLKLKKNQQQSFRISFVIYWTDAARSAGHGGSGVVWHAVLGFSTLRTRRSGHTQLSRRRSARRQDRRLRHVTWRLRQRLLQGAALLMTSSHRPTGWSWVTSGGANWIGDSCGSLNTCKIILLFDATRFDQRRVVSCRAVWICCYLYSNVARGESADLSW